MATDKEEVPAASKAWADDEVAVYAIGIGSGIDQQGLIDIAGTEERVLRAKDFDAIAALAKNLMHQVCAAGNLHDIIKQSVFTLLLITILVVVYLHTCHL